MHRYTKNLTCSATSRRQLGLTLAALLIWLGCYPAAGQERSADNLEAEIKAVFLLNFGSLVQWPDSSFETGDSPLRYCVIGTNDVTAVLPAVLKGEKIRNRPINLLTAVDVGQIKTCHLVYIAHRSPDPKLIQGVGRNPVLLVTDNLPPQNGGMISLVRKDNRIHPAIDLRAIQQAGLAVSSKLLRIATVTNAEGTEKRR